MTLSDLYLCCYTDRFFLVPPLIATLSLPLHKFYTDYPNCDKCRIHFFGNSAEFWCPKIFFIPVSPESDISVQDYWDFPGKPDM